MDELFGILCFLGFLLMIVTLVGHGLWLLGAFLVRSLSEESSSEGRPCATCGSPRGVHGPACKVCGAFSANGMYLRERMDAIASLRHFDRMRARGEITDEQLIALRAAVEKQLHGVSVPASESLKASAPSSPATIVEPTAIVPPAKDLDSPPHIELEPSAASDSPRPSTLVSATVDVPKHEAPAPVVSVSPEPEFVSVELVDESSRPVLVVNADIASYAGYNVSRTEPLQTSPAPSTPVAPPPALADVMQSFMEQKNIRWGELLSGILIVVSAVGLVVSLRATLKEAIPYFPAFMFMLITAAIHFAGVYSLRRWNLKTTSRGVLIIGTLLIPLNFLAAVILAGTGASMRSLSDPTYWVAIVIGLISFGTMNYYAARSLLRVGWWRLMVAVLGTSISQLLINRLTPDELNPLTGALLLAIPIGSFLIATVAVIRVNQRRKRFTLRGLAALFLEGGLGTFALLAPIGLLIAKLHSWSNGFANLSPTLSVIGGAVLAWGLVIHTKATSRSFARFRTAGTSVAIFGAGLLAMMVVLAWPQPHLLIAVGLVNAAVLIALAVATNMPVLNIAAITCLALAALVGFHVGQHAFDNYSPQQLGPRMVEVLLLGRSSIVLTIMAAMVGGIGAIFLRRSRSPQIAVGETTDPAGQIDLSKLTHPSSCFLTSAILASLGLLGAIYAGFFARQGIDTQLITPLLVVYVAATLGVAIFVNRKALAWLASAVMFLAIVHALALNDWTRDHWFYFSFLRDPPVVASAVLHSLFATAIAMVAAWQVRANRIEIGRELIEQNEDPNRASRWREFISPFCWSAIVSSIVALPFAMWVVRHQYGTHGGYLAVIASVFLVVALAQKERLLIGLGQAVATLGLAYFTTAFCLQRPWWTDWWFDPRFLQTQFVVLSICSAMASLLRQYVPTTWEPWIERIGCPRESSFLATIRGAIWDDVPQALRRVTVDQVVFGGVVRAFCVMGIIACYPGTMIELGYIQAEMVSERSGMFTAFASSAGSWFTCGALLVILCVYYRERQSRITIAGMLIVLGTIPLLLGARFTDERAVASALRWLFAIYSAILAIIACWWGGERPQDEESLRLTWQRRARILRWFAISTGISVVVTLTTATLSQVAVGANLGGPATESIFNVMGSSLSFGVPLGLLVMVALAFAIREGKPGYALAGSALFQYLVSLACVLPAITAGEKFDNLIAIRFLQWNAIGLAAYALVGIVARRWIERNPAKKNFAWEMRSWLDIQLGLTIVANVVLTAVAVFPLVSFPSDIQAMQATLASGPSYLSLLTCMATVCWYTRGGPLSRQVGLAAASATGLVAIAAVSLHVWDGAARWCGYHSLFVGWTMVAAALTCFVCWRSARHLTTQSAEGRRPDEIAIRWNAGLCVLVVLGAIRGVWNDPEAPWWSSGLIVGVMLIVTALGLRGRCQPFAYISTGLAGLSATLFALSIWHMQWSWNEVLACELVGTSMLQAAIFWLAIDLWYQKRRYQDFDTDWGCPTVYQVVTGVGTAAAVFWFCSRLVIERVFSSAWTPGFFVLNWLGGTAVLLSLGILIFASLWERKSVHTLFCLYWFGVAVGIFSLVLLRWNIERSAVALGVALGSYVAITGHLWKNGVMLSAIGHRLGVPDPVAGLKQVARWLPTVSLILTFLASAIALLSVLGVSSRELRVASALCPALAAGGLLRLAQKRWRGRMQWLSLVLLVGAAVLMGWADIGVSTTIATWLTRLIRLVMVLAAATVLYGSVLVRALPAGSDWRDVVRRVAVTLGGTAIVALLFVLAIEASLFVPGVGAPVDDAQVVAVSVVLVVLVGGLLSMAILPGRDPFALTERGRTAYVYGAQAVAVLILAHIYMAKPFWFDGVLKPWWPYILMAIAFGGVGVGELFQRLGWRVLAEPLQKTGAFMPLLPLIGMWAIHSDSDYSMVLFVMGLLYAMLSITRRSWVSGVAAGLAGNGALWAFLFSHTNITLWAQPQFWLIPPAASVLVAAQINRKRLSAESLTTVRYLCMLVIYISSTSEIFITGVGESIWPPIILASLAIFGVFLGIALQVRAFLYMGCSFVLLAMISMVWHASRSIQHSWPWWAFSIFSGLMILVFLGVLEKKRPEMMQWIARIREWEK